MSYKDKYKWDDNYEPYSDVCEYCGEVTSELNELNDKEVCSACFIAAKKENNLRIPCTCCGDIVDIDDSTTGKVYSVAGFSYSIPQGKTRPTLEKPLYDGRHNLESDGTAIVFAVCNCCELEEVVIKFDEDHRVGSGSWPY